MEGLFYLLLYFALFGGIGAMVGQRRNRTGAGFFFGSLLGPIGWLLVFLGPTAGDAAMTRPTDCPHCGVALRRSTPMCAGCGKQVRWVNGRAVRPSRLA